jgi:hypothetical protein
MAIKQHEQQDIYCSLLQKARVCHDFSVDSQFADYMQICGLAICGLAHQEICGFAIAE